MIEANKKEIIKMQIKDGGLGKYGLPSEDKGLTKIVDTWAENKSSLMELLSKHPNWNPDKYMITFDTTVDREIDSSKVGKFLDWVYRQLPPGVKWTDTLCSLKYHCEKEINEKIAAYAKHDYPDCKIVAGQKTSRAVNKILLSLGFKGRTYEQQFAQYADALSPLQITRHTVISLHPNDYLLMSNGNSWSSCHTINKHDAGGGYRGCRCSGTLSYMLDRTSLVYYQVDREYTGDNLELQPKIVRQMFHYADGILIQGRLYPQCNDGKNSLYVPIRAVLQKIIADCLGVPNLWRKKGGSSATSDFIHSYGTHYRDYNYQNECNVSRIFEYIPEGEDRRKIDIGAEPICPICGRNHNREEWLYCSHCGNHSGDGGGHPGDRDYDDDGYYCEQCGEWVDRDDVHWVGDEPYCDDCVTWCSRCESYHLNEDTRYIASTDEYVCDNCLEEYFTRCEHCDEWHPNTEMTMDVHDNMYCSDCAEECLTLLDDEYYPKSEVKTCPACGQIHTGEDDLCEECKEEAEGER